jgi:hypothetical protein
MEGNFIRAARALPLPVAVSIFIPAAFFVRGVDRRPVRAWSVELFRADIPRN